MALTPLQALVTEIGHSRAPNRDDIESIGIRCPQAAALSGLPVRQ
jgi:hypothetical protein